MHWIEVNAVKLLILKVGMEGICAEANTPSLYGPGTGAAQKSSLKWLFRTPQRK